MLNLPIPQLENFAQALFEVCGMDENKAQTVARLLVLTDAIGRSTHGLAMAALYLADIQKGGMTVSGDAQVVKDNGISAVRDGNYLQGLWLVDQTIKLAIARAQTHGLAAVAIRKSHHIGCLAVLVKQAADQGLVTLVTNSDPAGQRVARYGGTEALLTPNPLAMGYPAGDDPVPVDICASITTTSMKAEVRRRRAVRASVAAGRARRADTRPGGAGAQPAARFAATAGRPGMRSQGLRPVADDRSAVAEPVGPRTQGSAQALGRQCLRAGDRPEAVHRSRRIYRANGASVT